MANRRAPTAIGGSRILRKSQSVDGKDVPRALVLRVEMDESLVLDYMENIRPGRKFNAVNLKKGIRLPIPWAHWNKVAYFKVENVERTESGAVLIEFIEYGHY